MTTPNSPLSPSSVSASSDEDDRFDGFQGAPHATASAAALSSASADPSAAAAALSKGDAPSTATRRHSLSSTSTSSFSSPHLPSHYTDTSVSSASSTPISTPSSASTPGTSPFTHPHSLAAAQATAKAAAAAQSAAPLPLSSSLSSPLPAVVGGGAPATASMSSDAAVLANSATLAKAMLASQSAIVGNAKGMSGYAHSGYPSPSSLASLSALQQQHGAYPNRPVLPSPLASLPPLALSFSSHSSSALTPSAAAAAAASTTNSSLSSLTNAFQSSLLKGAAAAAGALTLNQLMGAATANGMMGAGPSQASSPLAPYLGGMGGEGLGVASSMASLSSVSPSAAAASGASSYYTASSPALSSLSASMATSSPSSFSSPAPSSSFPSSSSLPSMSARPLSSSGASQTSAYNRLPSTASHQAPLQTLYPSNSVPIPSLPAAPISSTSAPRPMYSLASPQSPISVSSATPPQALPPVAPSSSSLPSHASVATLAWPTTYKSPTAVLNRYLIHFPHDTAHGAQSGLYQPGKPSQLIIRMQEPEGSAAPLKEGEEGPVIRIPCKVALKPTVKRTAKLRALHEISMHPQWYDCETRDLSEEEKRWETGSKHKRPKYLLLRQDTKSMIHVVHVMKWHAEEAAEEERALAAINASSVAAAAGRENGAAAASTGKAGKAGSSSSSNISGLLQSLAAAGGVVSAGSAGLSSTIPLSPLHLLPVSEDSMAHVQTKGRGKTEERRKETAQLYLSLKVDKCQSHVPSPSPLSHYAPLSSPPCCSPSLAVRSLCAGYELRCHGGWKIHDMEMKHHKGGHQISNVLIPFHHLPEVVTVGEAVQAITALAGAGAGNGSGTAPPPLISKKLPTALKLSKSEAASRSNGDKGGDGDNGSTEKKGGKAAHVKTEDSGGRGNGRSSGSKRKSASKEAPSNPSPSREHSGGDLQRDRQKMYEQLVNSMMPYTASSPVYMQPQHMSSFAQLSPTSPGPGSMYPQLPSIPGSIPLSISAAFDPSMILAPSTPGATLSPNTLSALSGGLSPNTLFTLSADQYSALLNKSQTQLQSQAQLQFIVSSNSAFKTRLGKGDKGDDDVGGGGGGSAEKRRKVESGDGDDSKGEGAQDDAHSTLSGTSAGEELMGGGSSSSSSSAVTGALTRQRDVSAGLDPMYVDNFLLRSESAASAGSLPGGTTVSLHQFGASTGMQNLLPPPASFSSALSKPGHPTPIKIPTASRLSPSLSPLLSQQLGMSLSPSPNLVSLGTYTLSPPPSTPSLIESDPLFALASVNTESGPVRR